MDSCFGIVRASSVLKGDITFIHTTLEPWEHFLQSKITKFSAWTLLQENAQNFQFCDYSGQVQRSRELVVAMFGRYPSLPRMIEWVFRRATTVSMCSYTFLTHYSFLAPLQMCGSQRDIRVSCFNYRSNHMVEIDRFQKSQHRATSR